MVVAGAVYERQPPVAGRRVRQIRLGHFLQVVVRHRPVTDRNTSANCKAAACSAVSRQPALRQYSRTFGHVAAAAREPSSCTIPSPADGVLADKRDGSAENAFPGENDATVTKQ